MHAEKSSHHAAHRTGAQEPSCGGTYIFLKLLLEETEIETEEYKHVSQDGPHHRTFDPVKHQDCDCRESGKCSNHRQKSLPGYIFHILNHHYCGGSQGQQTREGHSLCIRRHQEGQCGHNEYAEPEADCALNKAGSRCQKYDVYQILHYCMMLDT